MAHAPRWCLTTTPHSGTRYVRDAFINAGLKTTTQRTTKYHIEGQSDFIWGHCERTHPNWMEIVHETWPDIRDFLVVRDPIHNLCTHMADIEGTGEGNRPTALRQIGDQLDLYRRIQGEFVELYNPHIHKVEDPIASLGDWAGIELKHHEKSHHRPNRLRAAVDARDMDLIFQTIRYSNLWEWFITEHSANIAPLYRDQLGYDFWWYNG